MMSATLPASLNSPWSTNEGNETIVQMGASSPAAFFFALLWASAVPLNANALTNKAIRPARRLRRTMTASNR